MTLTEKIRSERVWPPAVGDADHFIVCPTCGARLDMRRLDQVLEHEERHADAQA